MVKMLSTFGELIQYSLLLGLFVCGASDCTQPLVIKFVPSADLPHFRTVSDTMATATLIKENIELGGLQFRGSVHYHHGVPWHSHRHGAREGAENSTSLIHRQQEVN